MQKPDLVVVGAGAAGLMAAGTAARRGLTVWLVEKNAKPGRKLAITGKGRCNLTNNCTVQEFLTHVPTNPRFLYSALSRFTPQDCMALFEDLGVPLKTERGRRVFPVSDSAQDVVQALTQYALDAGVLLLRGSARQLLLRAGRATGVQLSDGRRVEGGALLLCCGGASYPATGSNGAGYRLAQQAGHSVTPLRPSLVPLVCEGTDCRDLMGLSLRNVSLCLWDCQKKARVHEELGELLFTHFGLSGPIALSASAHLRDMAPGRYRAEIDLKPGLTLDKLDARLQRDFGERPNRAFANSLGALLPHKLIPVVVRRAGIPPQTPCNALTRAQRHAFGALLKQLPFEVQGFRPLEEAIVTAGGVDVREVDPRSMQSKRLPGLYFAGEILDVDGYTGGYNLQIAFATGRAAGESVGS